MRGTIVRDGVLGLFCSVFLDTLWLYRMYGHGKILASCVGGACGTLIGRRFLNSVAESVIWRLEVSYHPGQSACAHVGIRVRYKEA